MDFMQAMRLKPVRLELLPADRDRQAMTAEERERLEAHERINRQREDAQFERLTSQPREA